MSVLARRDPTRVQPSGGVVIVASVFAVTNSSMPSVSRTELGIVTRAVVWFQAACALARKAMVSAAIAGGEATPSTANSEAIMAPTAATTVLPRTERMPVCDSIIPALLTTALMPTRWSLWQWPPCRRT